MVDWKAALGVAAPAIATALGGPLAGVAVGTLAKFFGLGDGASEQDIAKAMGVATPDQIIALRQIDADFKAKMTQANVDLERIAMEDRTSARDMAKVSGGNFQIVITVCMVLMFVGCLAAMFLGHMESLGADTKTLLNYAIGQISGWVGAAIVFYFGSSSSSRDKDNLIKRLSDE